MLLPLERSSISKIAEGSAENFCGTITCTPSLCGSICGGRRVAASLRTTHAAYSGGFCPEMTTNVGGVCLISATEAHPPIAKARTNTLHFILKPPIKTLRQLRE